MIEVELEPVSEGGRLFVEGTITLRIEVASAVDGVKLSSHLRDYMASMNRSHPCFPPAPHPADREVEPDLFKQLPGA